MAAFTAQLPNVNVMAQLGNLLSSSATGSAGLNVQSRATFTLGNKRIVQKKELQNQNLLPQRKHASNWFDSPASAVPGFDYNGGIHNQFPWNNFKPNLNKVGCGPALVALWPPRMLLCIQSERRDLFGNMNMKEFAICRFCLLASLLFA